MKRALNEGLRGDHFTLANLRERLDFSSAIGGRDSSSCGSR
jgi:hypothetical protein